MAKYLRDEHLKDLTITEQTLDQINDFLIEREISTNEKLESEGAEDTELLLLNYIIRFDNRGFKPNEYSELKKYYAQANKVERIIFTLDSTVSVNSNRLHGTHYEVRIDSQDPNNTSIQVSSDDGDAVDSVFCGLLEIINKAKNRNNFVRNTWSQLIVQIFGVVTGFVLSLIAGIQAAPHIKIENSFVITFLFAFLIFSNAWGFINQQILRLLEFSFPNVKFTRAGKSSFHWLAQTIVGGIIVAFTLFIIGGAFDWVGSVLGQYVGDNNV